MKQVKVSPSGQIFLPVALRKDLGIKEGDKLDLEVVDGAIMLKPKVRLSEYKGIDDELPAPAKKGKGKGRAQ